MNAYFFKWETSGRGAIHAHGEVWLPDLHPTRLRQLLQRSDACETMKQFMESICVMVAPGFSELGTSLTSPSTQAQAGFFRPQLPT